MLLFISGGEIFIVILVIVMFFGANKVPEIARELGKGLRVLRDATDDVKREIRDSSTKVREEYQSNIQQVKRDVEQVIEPENKSKSPDTEQDVPPPGPEGTVSR